MSVSLSQSQIENIERIAGYQTVDLVVRDKLSSPYSQAIYDQVIKLIDQLEQIDLLLDEALDTSFVRESGRSKLSYGAHVRHLKSEGTRLLMELTHILDISIRYNKYNPSPSVNRVSPTVSYW
ncbi:hypothetical protein [Picosynechococcus sp. PCC 7117]|uniref:hypothetical protein n=1 Tax=Picosynechococcus sp. PCC 7117 TaxID=195498 RepID=UPI0008103C02|nr:hypothetical protein [Picosynechococcus sp. PCC 7117]ANV88489.1 hypothetical protein AWQ22_14035 [Picosynechococcus sp. PCC 7117]